jgi:hypothetical protein
MIEDIVTRLHKCAEWHKGTAADCDEWLDAATEITRLRKENARLWERICEADEMLFNQARTIQSYQDAAVREGGKG